MTETEAVKLHVAQAVRIRFTEEELRELRVEILSSAANKYPDAPLDANVWRWFSRVVGEQVEAIDQAHDAYGLSSEKVRKILIRVQDAYYRAFCRGQDETEARKVALAVARLCLEDFFVQYN